MMTQIDTVREITSSEFLAKYLSVGRPLVVRGAASDFPCAKWSFEQLRSDLAEQEIKIQVFDSPSTRMANWRRETRTFAAYVDEMSGPAGLSQYLIGPLFRELVSETRIPEFVAPHVRGATTAHYQMFVGPPGQRSEIHYHPVFWGGASQAVAFTVCGRKLFKLYSPKDTKNLYPFPLKERLLRQANWSQVELDESEHFPNYSDSQPFEVELAPGDLLYIPAHWWHSAHCLEPSFTLTLFFKGRWNYRISKKLLARDLSVVAKKKFAKAVKKIGELRRSG